MFLIPKTLKFEQWRQLLTTHIQFRENQTPKSLLILLAAILKKSFSDPVEEIHFYTGETEGVENKNHLLKWRRLAPIEVLAEKDPTVSPGSYLGQLELAHPEYCSPHNRTGWIKISFNSDRKFSVEELILLELIRRNFAYALNQLRFDFETNRYLPFIHRPL